MKVSPWMLIVVCVAARNLATLATMLIVQASWPKHWWEPSLLGLGLGLAAWLLLLAVKSRSFRALSVFLLAGLAGAAYSYIRASSLVPEFGSEFALEVTIKMIYQWLAVGALVSVWLWLAERPKGRARFKGHPASL